jgi:hypothetical protein
MDVERGVVTVSLDPLERVLAVMPGLSRADVDHSFHHRAPG